MGLETGRTEAEQHRLVRKANVRGMGATTPRVVAQRRNADAAATSTFVMATLALLAAAMIWVMLAGTAAAQNVRPPSNASQSLPPNVGGNVQTSPDQGGNYNIEMWSQIRKNAQGSVSIPDKKSGILVDSSGESWRSFRNGPLPAYGGYALGGIIVLLGVFYLLRGKVMIDHGRAGWTIERFTDIERMGHWLLATSFIILALTGLNVLYGRDVLMPIIGKEAFASMSIAAKWLHNYVAFAFMLGLLITFVLWIKNNIPSSTDLVWFAKGGGLFGGEHPPAKKFNGGQKVLFWLVMLGGVSISLSGLQLLFPYELPMFAKTFAFLNSFGMGLPTELTPNQEQQFATSWHGIMALFLTVVIIAHIYIGSIGMEGAFDAMGSGQVDANWAKEHHSIWADEVIEGERVTSRGSAPTGGGSAKPVPAE
ncbi:MAG: formate dehydrogenase subunit gamma [Pseudomonadota bacterium]